ncbi:tyrosine-type recombinase/integrase [Mycobacterium sp.]|uniref:tyrosine-type recombinase/integrase n=1 Tax=Mycobacterium sp. TaxID=1785 RepID=UPI0025FF6A9A|nr:tyrosine-type recombinase/integrase [Mycobacterium sp.]
MSTPGLGELLQVPMHHRTRIMIVLAAYAGLRVHEIAKVRGEDVDLDRRVLRVTGKGARTDEIPMHSVMLAAALTMPKRGWWFPANSRRPGDHVHPKSVSDIIGNAMRRAELSGTPHSLRHWYATTLVEGGADIWTVKELMRHANLQTTAIYVRVADTRRQEAIERLALPMTPGSDISELPGNNVGRYKSAVVLVLEKLNAGDYMTRWKLNEAVRSELRSQLDAALDELVREGLIDLSSTDRGTRSYQLTAKLPTPGRRHVS